MSHDTLLTNTFRDLMKNYNLPQTFAESYSFLQGRLMYNDEVIDDEATLNERRCLDHTFREVLNQITNPVS